MPTCLSLLFHYPRAERRGEFVDAMDRVRAFVAGLPGCLDVHVYRQVGGEAVVSVGRWVSADALAAARERLAAEQSLDVAFDDRREARPREATVLERLPDGGASAGPGGSPEPKFVLLYESADDVASKAPAQFPAHKARLDEFRARGELLMVGTFGDPQAEGSMAVFRSRAGAEEFAAGDPFVLTGVVRAWHLRQWNEVLGG